MGIIDDIFGTCTKSKLKIVVKRIYQCFTRCEKVKNFVYVEEQKKIRKKQSIYHFD